jgi:aromatic amino acid transport protein AroP
VANLWQHGGFFPNGVKGLVMAMAVIMFSFGGLELIGITAAEADNPSHSIPRRPTRPLAHPDLLHRRAGILLSLYPWRKIVHRRQPVRADLPGAEQQRGRARAERVVLTAALSVYNSCVYANTRMLYGLAKQGNAPRALLKVNERGVPLAALGVSAWRPASASRSTTSCRARPSAC